MTEPEKLIYNWYLAEPVESFLENDGQDPRMDSDSLYLSIMTVDVGYIDFLNMIKC